MNAVQTQIFDLETIVLAQGLASAETMARARLVEAETGERLDSVLTRLGMVSERALAAALARTLGLALLDLEQAPTEAVLGPERLSPRYLRAARAIPVAVEDDVVLVAVVDPFDETIEPALRLALGRRIRRVVATVGDVETLLERYYGREGDLPTGDEGSADDTDLERLKDLTSDAPVVRLVNALIGRAVEARASDIHLEPAEDRLKVRFRIDGALREEDPIANAMKSAVVSRIKVMSGLDIAERRLPQDGRLRWAVRGQEIDFRVATAPSIHGETVVLRILDRSSLSLDFDALGFEGQQLAAFLEILHRPHGIVLVTGPTGSGKTTTLYAALSVLNTPERKILTVEDPIEYRLDGICQTQTKHQIGLTFAAALRSFLRQDPDVIMVGEIRDLETAQVAVQAALTGHTILSTLHTNDAASAVTRLLDMGVENYLITSTLNGVLAQRLVRRLCPECRAEAETDEAVIASLWSMTDEAVEISRVFRPVGCPACGGTGFRGRLAITELLPMDEQIAHLVMARAEARDIRKAAIVAGMKTMLSDGIGKVVAGLTTVEEILRVTRED